VGTAASSGSWLLAKTVWITLAVTLPILAWWGYFLILWPQLVRQSLNNLPQNEVNEQ
jgi:hypothetical protein